MNERVDAGARPGSPITPRAILLGTLSVATLALINPYLAFISRTWNVGEGSLLRGPLVVLFLFVLLNGLLLRLWPGRAFTRGELLVVYGMLIISIGFVETGGLPYMVSATTYPFYMAQPANQWQYLIWPHIPVWLRLSRPESVSWFWEGMPPGASIPWSDWATPLLAWGSFTLALMAGMFCLGALMSKDWIERQRLAFPLVDVPLAITGDGAKPTLRDTLFNSRVFWLGFAVPAFLAVLSWLHGFFPNVPAVQLYALPIGRYFGAMGLPWSALSQMRLSILFPMIGIGCLVPAEVSLSLWFFYFLYLAQLLVWGSFGVAEEGGTAALGVDPRAFIAFQEAGGFIALTVMMLYLSRSRIKAAVQDLVGRGAQEPDPSGPVTGRWALIGFVLANAFMIWWAMKAGMSWWSFVLLIAVFYAVLVGASRLVSAGGVMSVDTGFFPRRVVMGTLGAASIGAQSLTMYAYVSAIFMYDPMSLAMPQVMNSFKLLHTGRLRGKRWPLAAALSMVTVLVAGLVALLVVLYHHGASTLSPWPFTYPSWAFSELDSSLRLPEAPNNSLRLALFVGAAFTLLLTWLNTTCLWWPLSPVGFLIASAWETNNVLWANMLIAWGLTGVVRRYGGLTMYRAMRPAFLGLVLGEYLTRAVLAVLSGILGAGQTAG